MAKVDYFLKIDGIPGESQDAAHRGEIDILSFHWGETNSGSSSGGGGGAGKVEKQDLTFVKQVDVSSPGLLRACTVGEHIRNAVLTLRNGGFEFLQITLEDVLVTSYNIDGSEGGTPAPLEQITLDFAKLDFAYRQQSTGNITRFGFDYKASRTT